MTFQYSSLAQRSGDFRGSGSDVGADAFFSIVDHLKSSKEAQRYLHMYPAQHDIFVEAEMADVTVVALDGWVECSKSLLDGERQIIDFLLPGDFVHPSQGDGANSFLDVRAVTDCTVAIVPAVAWQRLTSDTPGMSEAVQNVEATQRTRILERLLRIGKGSATMRVAYVLLELSSRVRAMGFETEGAFHLPVTQQALSEFAGLSAVHVCRMLRSFVEDGLIETSGHMDVLIKDRKKLSEIAGLDLREAAAGTLAH